MCLDRPIAYFFLYISEWFLKTHLYMFYNVKLLKQFLLIALLGRRLTKRQTFLNNKNYSSFSQIAAPGQSCMLSLLHIH